MIYRKSAQASVALALAALPLIAQAGVVGGAQIAASTSLPTFGNFTIDQIVDGITNDNPPYNGFASTAQAGTITLDFDQSYDLAAFVLWNDISVLGEGIAEFRLDFFDASLALITSTGTLVGPQGQLEPATYSFSAVEGVNRVDLVVLSSHAGTFQRIEIREVAFETASSVPEPASATLAAIALLGVLGASRQRRLAR